MKKSFVVILLVLFLVIFISCQNIQNIVNPINNTIQETTTPIGIVTDMHCTAVTIPPALVISIAPTSKAIAGKAYLIELYEKGMPRDKGTISWNQPQINVNDPVDVFFPISLIEFDAYRNKDITGIFSIKILEQTSSTSNSTEGTSTTSKHRVTVATDWETLFSWGITAEELETVIGEKSPGYGDILEYCYVKHKDSSAVVTALQKLVDKHQ